MSGENPYAPPGVSASLEPPSNDSALRRLRPPAILLLAIAGITIVAFVYDLLSSLYFASTSDDPLAAKPLRLWEAFWHVYVLILLNNVVVIYGSIQMLRGRQYFTCMTSALLAAVPCCSPGFLLGIPFAIWALMILNRPETRAAFAEAT